MAQVFISYKREDRHLTEDLASYLEGLGYSVWWDTRLVSGDDIDDVIVNAIDGAEAAVVIWTRNSIGSKWVKSEARRADRQGKLIPVRVADLDLNDVPPPFDNYHMDLLSDRERITAALVARGVVPQDLSRSPNAPPPSPAVGEGAPREIRSEELRREDEARKIQTATAPTEAVQSPSKAPTVASPPPLPSIATQRLRGALSVLRGRHRWRRDYRRGLMRYNTAMPIRIAPLLLVCSGLSISLWFTGSYVPDHSWVRLINVSLSLSVLCAAVGIYLEWAEDDTWRSDITLATCLAIAVYVALSLGWRVWNTLHFDILIWALLPAAAGMVCSFVVVSFFTVPYGYFHQTNEVVAGRNAVLAMLAATILIALSMCSTAASQVMIFVVSIVYYFAHVFTVDSRRVAWWNVCALLVVLSALLINGYLPMPSLPSNLIWGEGTR